MQRKDCKLSYSEEERRRERKEMQKDRQTSQNEVWKIALSLCAERAELATCQRRSRRIAEKDGDDGKVAASGSSSEREQVGGGNSTKVEAAKRRGQVQNEERGNDFEVPLAE